MSYDAWLEGPYTNAPEACDNCADEGCYQCDRQMAEDWHWARDPRV